MQEVIFPDWVQYSIQNIGGRTKPLAIMDYLKRTIRVNETHGKILEMLTGEC
jgi:hypothetical protein